MTDWNSETVAMRLQEAAKTAHRLPPVRVQGYFNLWPHFARTEFERLSMEAPSPIHFSPSPREVDRMLEVMGWMLWIDVEARKLLWMRAERHRWADIARRFGYSPRTAQRHWNGSVSILLDNLSENIEGN